jgi:hypothetical protein
MELEINKFILLSYRHTQKYFIIMTVITDDIRDKCLVMISLILLNCNKRSSSVI